MNFSAGRVWRRVTPEEDSVQWKVTLLPSKESMLWLEMAVRKM